MYEKKKKKKENTLINNVHKEGGEMTQALYAHMNKREKKNTGKKNNVHKQNISRDSTHDEFLGLKLERH
jgi:hypothetical protein